MLATIDGVTSPPTVAQADAQRAAHDYVAAHLDPTFEVVSGAKLYSKSHQREIWQFMIRCAAAPLGVLAVDAQTGKMLPLTAPAIRVSSSFKLVRSISLFAPCFLPLISPLPAKHRMEFLSYSECAAAWSINTRLTTTEPLPLNTICL